MDGWRPGARGRWRRRRGAARALPPFPSVPSCCEQRAIQLSFLFPSARPIRIFPSHSLHLVPLPYCEIWIFDGGSESGRSDVDPDSPACQLPLDANHRFCSFEAEPKDETLRLSIMVVCHFGFWCRRRGRESNNGAACARTVYSMSYGDSGALQDNRRRALCRQKNVVIPQTLLAELLEDISIDGSHRSFKALIVLREN